MKEDEQRNTREGNAIKDGLMMTLKKKTKKSKKDKTISNLIWYQPKNFWGKIVRHKKCMSPLRKFIFYFVIFIFSL